MHTIWKFPVHPSVFVLELPRGARFLDVQTQGNAGPQMRFLVDPDAEKVKRQFASYGTGHSVSEAEKLTHLGTFQLLQEERLVFHLFEYDAPRPQYGLKET